MYCPGCGTEDNTSNVYCRSCGSDLRAVRTALERPDDITSSAVSARQEIGRAFADRIRQARAKDLASIAEEVLPEVEKFLESPEERRLRNIRNGAVTAFIGFGTALAFFIVAASAGEPGITFFSALGIVTFFIGVALIINGYFLTVTKKELSGGVKRDEGESVSAGELPSGGPDQTEDDASTNELLMPPSARDEFIASVTEETTRNLEKKHSEVRSQETEDH
ncbi:MAG: hypothetical protein IPM63_16275 [Acidobacteriota bacterium]|nr:MAG: hypothetical protein IPM63_16275 [Acidobacteriota bacterium]